MDIKEQDILKETVNSHWYYISKELALRKFVQGLRFKKILDVGAGSGIFSKMLLMNSCAKEAICLDVAYPLDKEENFCGKKINFCRTFTQSIPDLVLFMDVLEHIEDDVSFIREYVQKSEPETHFVITVPAFQFLFSGHDIFLGHHRRYSISSIESCLHLAGLNVIKSSYFFSFIVPFAFPIRILEKIKMKFYPNGFIVKSNLKTHENFLNKALISLNKLELPFFPFNRIGGLSIFSLAVKK